MTIGSHRCTDSLNSRCIPAPYILQGCDFQDKNHVRHLGKRATPVGTGTRGDSPRVGAATSQSIARMPAQNHTAHFIFRNKWAHVRLLIETGLSALGPHVCQHTRHQARNTLSSQAWHNVANSPHRLAMIARRAIFLVCNKAHNM